MLHFFDVSLLPDPESSTTHLMAALYSKFHFALVRSHTSSLAVSFPQYAKSPCGVGSVLRILGSPSELQALLAFDWLGGMRDQVRIESIGPVPATTEHKLLQRVQPKSSVWRLRRRHMKRHGVTELAATNAIPDSAAELVDLPFVQMASHSTGQRFRLYLRLRPAVTAISGTFNSYGLSATATIPWF